MKAELKPMERIRLILERKETDRPAYVTPTSVATVDSMRLTGAFFPEAHLQPEKMAALAAAGPDLCGFDTIAPYFSVLQEAVALGSTIDFGTENTMPSVHKHAFSDPEEFVMPDNLLALPPLKCLLDTIRMLKEKYRDSAVIVGKVMGPWTLSYHLHGIQDFLMETIAEPEKVHAFLEVFRHVSVSLAVAQAEAGADMITWADHATGDLVSAAGYEEFLFPVHCRCVKELKERMPRSTPMILHTCGHTLDRISLFAKTGFDIFHFDSRNNLNDVIRMAGDGILLAGCVNITEVLLNGTADDVRRQVSEIKAAGIRLIGPECAVPCLVKNENLRAITENR